MRVVLAIAALFVAPLAIAQTAPDYWYIGMSSGNGGVADAVTFMDANRVQGEGSIRRAWVWGYFEEATLREDDITRMQSLEEFDCAQRRSRTLQTTAYFRAERSVPFTETEAEDWSYVTPNTAGEWMLEFACGSTESRLASGRFVQLRQGLNLRDAAARLFEIARQNERGVRHVPS